MYYRKEESKRLKYNQMVICRCPNWCDEGYQVGRWNGKEFTYEADPNGWFDRDVIAFMPLNEDGEPTRL